MLQRCVGRVPSLCHAVSSCRVSASGCQAATRLSAGLTCRHHVQHFACYPGTPGAGDPNNNTDSTGDGTLDNTPALDISPSNDQIQTRSERGRRAWGRSLSPLDRLSQMIPPQFISQEIQDLRSAGGTSLQEELVSTPSLQEEPVSTPSLQEESVSTPSLQEESVSTPSLQEESVSTPSLQEESVSTPSLQEEPVFTPSLQGEPSRLDPPPPLGTAFIPGELAIAEFKRRHYTEFKKMFTLTDSGKLNSNWGVIGHNEIVGKLPGQRLRTSRGFELLLKRPSLTEYILLMKRGPTISYPKDIAEMMMMMDVSPGNVVLEAGSGSGGLTLFLSRAVGLEGRVYSFEVRADHHAIAKKNVRKWKSSWDIQSSHPWPENVHFINQDLSAALPDMGSVAFDAVALDMLNPQVALPAILQNLKQGGVCAVYVANITQVIDLLEGIRSCQLSLLCEKIKEISVKDWLVAPAVRKDGTISQRVEPQWNTESDVELHHEELNADTEELSNAVKPFGQVPYIARPLPWQSGHTAFLVQLRKIRAAPNCTEPEDSS
ncbi:tRNA (adenine(58)-N(1))-methyltransferase, mitochondrial isoform X2 [Xenopus laevis]|uniref:tRNA (adenine(58)-N(1))-methyltransferase n=1 Tax=Xenopus laevis TaxID=8355 RepID=A0A8J0V6J7_XENLA|nr:tRNA (adenine(58)-N(1))-methyltransferase, mitochondrial isoform X2 [Xenopus laevis]